MLGIEISDNKIKIVNLKRKRGKWVAIGTAELPYNKHKGDVNIIGEELLRLLAREGWNKKDAVMAITNKPCFVKRIEVNEVNTGSFSKTVIDNILSKAKNSFVSSAEHMIFDIWQPKTAPSGNRFALVGAAQKSSVSLAKQLAEKCDIKLKAIELSPVAILNGLMNCWHNAEEQNLAVIYKDGSRFNIAIFDSMGLVSIQTTPSTTGSTEAQANQILRVFNTIKLKSSNSLPSRIFLAGTHKPDAEDNATWQNELAATISHSTNMEVTPCLEDLDIAWQLDTPVHPQDFAGALGAAFEGTGISPISFDFLHIKEKKPQENKKSGLTTMLVAIFMFALLAMILWISIIGQRNATIHRLEKDIAAAEPLKEQVYTAQAHWVNSMKYIHENKGGSRLEYLKILYEISRLMPNTDKAYLTNLSVYTDKNENGYNVKLTVKATEATLITELIESLNQSSKFRDIKQDGARTHDETDEFYPISFSVTFNLNRPPAMKPYPKGIEQ